MTVFGLGEAGREIAHDLAHAGAVVHAFDPANVETPSGVLRHPEPGEALVRPHVVLGITAAADARTALTQAYEAIPRGTVYADLATGGVDLKENLEEIAALRGLHFVDVALMATVPGKGIRTPSFASGPGAASYVELMVPLGANVENIGDRAGDAAARKLLRSIVMKGLAASLIEAMRAAERSGHSAWLWRHLASELAAADETLVDRLVRGTETHALRRAHEMEAAASLLETLGVQAPMARAAAESLWTASVEGIPRVPDT